MSVDRNSASAPTPSIDSAAYAIASSVRTAICPALSAVPETLSRSVPGAAGSLPSSSEPTTYPTPATSTTASTVNVTTETNLATSSRSRLTGRTSR